MWIVMETAAERQRLPVPEELGLTLIRGQEEQELAPVLQVYQREAIRLL